MQEKIQKMMDLLKSAKFNVITIDGKILLTIKIEDKEHSFTLNWDGKQDYWRTIEIGKYYFDVNVWIEGGTRRTSAYPVIDGETVMTDFFPIYSEPLQKEEESKQKYYFVVVHELNNDKEYSINQAHAIDEKENVDEWLAKNVLVPWYGNGENGEMQPSGACEHFGGEIIVSIERYQEIPKEDFDVLSRYI